MHTAPTTMAFIPSRRLRLHGVVGLLILAAIGTRTMATDHDGFDLEHVREQIREQYSTIDENMISVHYRTRNRISQDGEGDRIEVTSVDPNRPAGEKEQLELVNGEPPGSRDIRRFERRPQPDQRDDQPFRLGIDYDSLQLEDRQGYQLTFRFQPMLLVNGSPDSDGEHFTGTLNYDLATDTLQEVQMELTQSFRKMLFTISEFTVTERFARRNGLLLRTHYAHDLDVGNRLVDFSNQSNMTFDYE